MPLFGSKKKADGGDDAIVAGGTAGDNDAEVFSMRGHEAAPMVRSISLFRNRRGNSLTRCCY
jgi:hypothetical protein